jgi:hypothetical protein
MEEKRPEFIKDDGELEAQVCLRPPFPAAEAGRWAAPGR